MARREGQEFFRAMARLLLQKKTRNNGKERDSYRPTRKRTSWYAIDLGILPAAACVTLRYHHGEKQKCKWETAVAASCRVQYRGARAGRVLGYVLRVWLNCLACCTARALTLRPPDIQTQDTIEVRIFGWILERSRGSDVAKSPSECLPFIDRTHGNRSCERVPLRRTGFRPASDENGRRRQVRPSIHPSIRNHIAHDSLR